jgi:hypothetical protein
MNDTRKKLRVYTPVVVNVTVRLSKCGDGELVDMEPGCMVELCEEGESMRTQDGVN